MLPSYPLQRTNPPVRQWYTYWRLLQRRPLDVHNRSHDQREAAAREHRDLHCSILSNSTLEPLLSRFKQQSPPNHSSQQASKTLSNTRGGTIQKCFSTAALYAQSHQPRSDIPCIQFGPLSKHQRHQIQCQCNPCMPSLRQPTATTNEICIWR